MTGWNPPQTHGLVYLSMPYSHPDKTVRWARMEAFWTTASELAAQGVFVVSPMSLEPALKRLEGRVDLDWATWEKYSKAVLDTCHELWILLLPGWEESVGVKAEIAYARQRAIRVRYVDPENQVIGERAP